jgi:hypothetical protein
MILSHTERQERIDARTAEFRAGEMTETVYRACLFALGMRGRDIDIEVRLNWPEKKRASKSV